MNPICHQCNREMEVMTLGISVSQYDQFSEEIKVYRGDLLVCPECRHEIIAKFGKPYHTHDKGKVLFVD